MQGVQPFADGRLNPMPLTKYYTTLAKAVQSVACSCGLCGIMRRVSFRYCPDCIVRGTLAKIYLDALRFADEVQVRRFGESAIVPASE